MATEAKEEGTKNEGAPSNAPSGTPAGGAPAGDKTPPAGAKPEGDKGGAGASEKKPPAADAGGAPAPKTPKKLSADDDDVPDDEEIVQMSPRALKARLTRASKAQLREAFGTDDIEAIQKKIAKGDAATVKEEEERKARLTAEERLKEERDAAIKERDEAKSRVEMVERARIVEKQDGRIGKIAAKHLDPDYIEDAFPKLATALLKAAKDGDKKLAKHEDQWIDNWFAEYVKAKPKLGKDFGATEETAPTKPEPKRLPFNNGPIAPKPGQQAPSGTLSVKTASPGKPNSMSDKEIRDLGYSYK